MLMPPLVETGEQRRDVKWSSHTFGARMEEVDKFKKDEDAFEKKKSAEKLCLY